MEPWVKNDINDDEKTANGFDASKPNIVYIVLDDMGYSDFGAYGSEIKTPNIDQLAANGLLYNNFSVTPLCSPTRASLLTGRDNHSVGMGVVADIDLGPDNPNIRGQLTPAAATIAQILRDQGYSTLGSGKWHLVPQYEASTAGPFNNWPLAKGFDRYYGFLGGETEQYHPQLVYDNHFIDPPQKEGYHLSEDLVDQSKQFITDVTSVYPEKPFFLWLAFGATHSPHQVPRKYIDMYKGVYDKGWDKIRAERLERQKQLGVVPTDTELAPSNPAVRPWDSLLEDEKRLFARFMEAYAGFLTHTDEQIGRFTDYLESIGKLDSTMIVLISDNGASSHGGPIGSDSFSRGANTVTLNDLLPRIDDIGGSDFQALYPMGWGQVSNTPFPQFKMTTYGGGTRTPLIISWPQGIKERGIRSQYVYVTDVTPTVLDVLNIKTPDICQGVPQMPMHGKSFVDSFAVANAPSKRTTQYFLMLDSRAIYSDGWKAVATHVPGTPFAQDKWELFNLTEDFSEAHNLADKYPDKLLELQNLWFAEAGKYGNGALPLVERDLRAMGAIVASLPQNPSNRTTFKYLPGTGKISSVAAPQIQGKLYTITVPVKRTSIFDEGVLVSHGDSLGGYTFYIKNNRLVYEYNYFTTIYKIESSTEVPLGSSILKFEFKKTGPASGTGILYIDDKTVGEGPISKVTLRNISFEGLDVGRDGYSPVSKSYQDQGEFPFQGQYDSVTFELL